MAEGVGKIVDVGARIALTGKAGFISDMKATAAAVDESKAATGRLAEAQKAAKLETDRYTAAQKLSKDASKEATVAQRDLETATRRNIKAQQEAATAANEASAAQKRAAAEGATADDKAAAAIKVAEQEKRDAIARTTAALEREATVARESAARQATAAQEAATAQKVAAAEATASSDAMAASAEKRAGLVKGAALGVVGITAVVAGVSVKMAADYQTSTNRLVTSGGVAAENLDMLRQGMLGMSGQLGVSAVDLSNAMYRITSAGYDQGAALGMLKAAQQGAKAEQADGVKVADALSSAMRDYYPAASSAEEVTKLSADTMSKMVEATSVGKMSFDQLAGGMSTILPIASQAHISLNDVLGTLASMTVHGVSVDQATQQMANAIQHLQNPSQQMSKQMAILGISSRDVMNSLGEKGLSGTLQGFSQKIAAAMPPGTDKVVMDLNTALKASSPAVQDLGSKLMDGSISYKEFTAAAGDFGAVDRAQSKQFLTLINATHQLGSANLAGGEVMQTYAGEMAKLTGTSSGLQVALETTGQNGEYTSQAIDKISKATADAQGNVKGWDQIQGTFNQTLSQAKDTVGSFLIQLGTIMLPTLTKVVQGFIAFTGYLQAHKRILEAVAVVLGAVLALSLVVVTRMVYLMIKSVVKLGVEALASGAKTAAGFLMAEWPILLIIAAVAALVLGFIYLYNHVQGFHDFVDMAMRNIRHWAEVAFAAVMAAGRWAIEWIQAHWGTIEGFFKKVWDGIVSGAKWAMDNIVTPVWNAIKEVIALFIPIIRAVKDHWDEIVQVAKFEGQVLIAWVQIIWGFVSAIFTTGVAIVKTIWDLFWNVLVTVLSVAWHVIQGVISIAWDLIIGIIKVARDIIMGIISIFLDIVTGNWSRAWEDIKHTVGAVWDDIFNLVKTAISSFVGMITNVLGDLAGGVKNIFVGLWNDVGGIFVAGVNGTIKIINGFLGAVNTIAGAVGITLNLHVDEIGSSGGGGGNVQPRRPGQQMANGGVIGGGFRTTGPEVLVGEGNAAYPEYVIPTDPSHRKRATALYRSLGGELVGGPHQALEGGGVIGWLGNAAGAVGGAIGGAAGAVWDGAKDIASAAENVAKMGLRKVLELGWPELSTSGNPIVDLLPGGANYLRTKAIDFVVGKDDAQKAAYANVGGGSGSIPSGEHLALINAALAADGIPAADWPRWEAGMDTLIGRESGWNAGVFNNWDINAQNGTPSGGLTQTILPTFNANRNPALSANMLDPVSNIAASINYIRNRYGDISSVQQANPNLPPQGYERGGIVGLATALEGREQGGRLNAGQSYIVGERRPEVFTPDQAGTMSPSVGGSTATSGRPATSAGVPTFGNTITFERGAVIVYESGDPQRTFEAVKMAVQDRLARQ